MKLYNTLHSIILEVANRDEVQKAIKNRNTNYLGELFIYLGFTLIAKDYLPLLALLTIIIFVWIPNMIKKDKSLSRYPDFNEYKNKSKAFFPFIF